MRPTRRRTLSPRPVAGALAAVLLLATACSGDEPEDEPDAPESRTTTNAAEPPLETTATIAQVVGKLGKKKQKHLVTKVTAMVDQWLDHAYVAGDYPRDDFGDAFSVFTDDAARFAEKQAGLMSNAEIGDELDAVVATKRRVRVDVLAPEGRPAGVTARFRLVMVLTGDGERKEEVVGRLMLTKTGKGWQVFGYDVTRDKVKKR